MCCLILVLFIAFSTQSLINASTSDLEERIKTIKRDILRELHQTETVSEESSESELENYEYIDNSNRPITPVVDFDPRKLKNRFKQPEFRTTKSHYVPPVSKEDDQNMHALRNKKVIKPKMAAVSKPKEIFYRKYFSDASKKNVNQKWLHCSELLSPYLHGHRNEIKFRLIQKDYPPVIRIIHLLTTNTSSYDTEDIRSIIYQLSNIPVRLFSWDYEPVTMLLNAVIKKKPHTFKNLKSGVKEIFKMWNLDISNLTTLLRQSRIFRPPCLPVTKFEGSTKTSKGIIYTKATKKPKICVKHSPEDDDDECDAGL